MTDRRRTPRYNLSRSTKAEINLLQDVSIQSAAGDDVVVLAAKCPESHGPLLLQVVRADGEVATLGAEIVDSAPVVEAGTVRFRLQLRVAGFASASGLNLVTPFE